MKTLVTFLLCLMLATPARTEPDPEPVAAAPVMLGLLVLGIGVAAAIVVIKVCSTVPSDTVPVTFVLEKSTDHANWIPVVTNTVTLNGQSPIEVFRGQMKEDVAFYRARKL